MMTANPYPSFLAVVPRYGVAGVSAGAALLALGACATVKLEAPDEPIEVNLNVNIQQDVRVRLEEDIETLISENPNIF